MAETVGVSVCEGGFVFSHPAKGSSDKKRRMDSVLFFIVYYLLMMPDNGFHSL